MASRKPSQPFRHFVQTRLLTHKPPEAEHADKWITNTHGTPAMAHFQPLESGTTPIPGSAPGSLYVYPAKVVVFVVIVVVVVVSH